VQFAYGLNYLIDDENAVIVDVEATPARISKEVASTKVMITCTAERTGLVPKHLAADSAYGTGALLGWLVDRGIDPHIPVWDKSERADGTLARADFTYDAEHDRYVCPQGKPLTSTGRVHDGRTLYYRSSKRDCDRCALKPRCCPKGPFRRIPRDINEHGRDHARALSGTQAFEDSSRRRKKIEMLFAHLKRQLGFDQLRLQGPTGGPRRIPPRRNCSEPQTTRAAHFPRPMPRLVTDAEPWPSLQKNNGATHLDPVDEFFHTIRHVWTALLWQGFWMVVQCWSVRPCVRPVDAAHMCRWP